MLGVGGCNYDASTGYGTYTNILPKILPFVVSKYYLGRIRDKQIWMFSNLVSDSLFVNSSFCVRIHKCELPMLIVKKTLVICVLRTVNIVADPGSGAFLTPGSDPELSNNFYLYNKVNNLEFVKFMATFW
jgi:hypothetical protein